MNFYKDFLSPDAVHRYFFELLDISGKIAQDKKNIIGQIGQGGFPFRTVAEEFRFIDEDTRTVYIPLGEGKDLAERLRQGDISRELFRKSGRYGVSIYEKHFQELNTAHALELLPDGKSAILTGPGLYSKETGLCLKSTVKGD